ncbi:DUF2516 family protein [Actinotalea sp. AC32]|nr:DUF2516 family protein [Actinotalea sp. AC32]
MIQAVQSAIFLALHLLVLVLCVVALVDALRRPARAFTAAGKRTRSFWLAILGVATALSFVATPFGGGGGGLLLFAILSAVAASVYLVDVKPAVAPYSGRGGPGGGTGSW